MARFLSGIFSERGSEVHRLGHNKVSNRLGSSYVTIDLNAYYTGKKAEYNPDTEFVNIEISHGYGEYGVHQNSFVLGQFKNGKIILRDDLMEYVEQWNKEVEARYGKKEN